jgi:hypothetical protein
VSVDVTNSGSRPGDEVVELYLSSPTSNSTTPVKQLKGFRRVTLSSGQKSTVVFPLTADELYYFNQSTNSYDVELGQFTIRVGGSSDNLPLARTFQVINAQRKPDLFITNIRTVPPYPLQGQKVIFLATVKNQGTAATTAGNPLKIAFSVNGQQVSWSDEFAGSIPAGGMALINANKGSNGVNTWTANGVGTYTVDAAVDPDNTVDECVEYNNTATAQLTVYPSPPVNLALNKSATVSSVEASGLEGSNAVDGDMGTRWSSAFSDPQFILVDLGAVLHVDDVTLFWETAYAKEYYIKVSKDSSTWVSIFHQVNGAGGVEKVNVSSDARWVQMLGVQRATQWGYSIYELQVHGSVATSVEQYSNMPSEFSLSANYPNPFNPTTTVEFTVKTSGRVTLRVFNVLGQEVAILFDGIADAGKRYRPVFEASGLPSGAYVVRLDSGNEYRCQRMVLLK